jgi:hypothetical protein
LYFTPYNLAVSDTTCTRANQKYKHLRSPDNKILRIDVTPGISDHDIVYAEMNMNSAINTQKPRKIPIYKKAK